jgi:outer membrane autotransporter protein
MKKLDLQRPHIGASGARFGTLAIDNSEGVVLNQDAYVTTLTLSGALSVAGDKVLDVTNAIDLSGQTFNSLLTSTAFGEIKSGAGVAIDSSTTINFDYSNTLIALDYSGATEYKIVESTGITGTVSDITITDNSYLFDNSIAASGNNIVTTISSSALFSEANLGTDNYNLVNNALQHTNVVSGVLSVSNKDDLEEGLKTLKPSTNGALINSSMAMNNNTINVTTLHLKSIDSSFSGFSTGDDKELGNGSWGKVFGGGSHQKIRDGIAGYNSSLAGFIMGADKTLDDREGNILFGTALSYNRSTIRGESTANSKDSVDSYQLIFYNNNSHRSGLGLYNSNLVNLAFNQYGTSRTIKIGSYEQVAKGKFNGMSQSIKSGFGYNMKLSDKFLLSPNAALQYFKLSQDAYQETGAGSAGLNVKNKDYSNFVSEIGFDITSKTNIEGYNAIPKLGLSWVRNLQNKKQESTVAFIGGGSEIQNNSITPQRDRMNIGLSLNLSDNENDSVTLGYNLQVASKFVSHIGSLQYRRVF